MVTVSRRGLLAIAAVLLTVPLTGCSVRPQGVGEEIYDLGFEALDVCERAGTRSPNQNASSRLHGIYDDMSERCVSDQERYIVSDVFGLYLAYDPLLGYGDQDRLERTGALKRDLGKM